MAGPTDATRAHRARMRPILLRELARVGWLPCPRCGTRMYPWHDLDVGHPDDVVDVGAEAAARQVLRLEHRTCNRQAGDRRRRRATGGQQQHPYPGCPGGQPAADVYSQEW